MSSDTQIRSPLLANTIWHNSTYEFCRAERLTKKTSDQLTNQQIHHWPIQDMIETFRHDIFPLFCEKQIFFLLMSISS